MNRIIRFLASVKLAVALIALLALLCGIATLVPQGLEESWYHTAYPEALARIVIATGYHGFFSSPLFMLCSGLFFINLLACTLRRFLAQLKRGTKGRYGPDILHTGILALIATAAFSGFFRVSVPIELAVGDGIALDGGISVQVTAIKAATHPDGRPKDWVTNVNIVTPLRPDGFEGVIRVNKPLSIAGASLHQYSWKQGDVARILAEGSPKLLESGASITLADGRNVTWTADLVSTGTQTRAAGLLIGHEAIGLLPGQEHAGVRLESIGYLERTVLLASRDRAYAYVAISFLIICVGLIVLAIDRFQSILKERQP